jgi:beta-1,4-mannosyl-glycoprotein beta-1,4-N-acetylglucosaminyltransferase
MKQKFGVLDFCIVTDDYNYATKILPGVEILRLNVHQSYYVLQNAPYLILSNSSFAFFPAWTNKNLKYCLAPEYWGGYNQAIAWVSIYNLVPEWNFMNRLGVVSRGTQVKENLSQGPKVSNKNIDRNSPSTLKQNIRIMRDGQLYTKYYRVTPRNIRFRISSILSRKSIRLVRIIRAKVLIELKKLLQKIPLIRKVFVKAKIIMSDIPITKKDKLKLVTLCRRRGSSKKIIFGKIYDIVYFHNEIDILQLRIEILKDFVDFFVIVESRTSFSGIPKQPFARQVCSQYSEIADKFIFIEVDNVPNSRSEALSLMYRTETNLKLKSVLSRLLTSSNVPSSSGPNQWVREFFIKEYPVLELDGIRDNDAVFISDVDEIWNPNCSFESPNSQVQLLKQRSYHYFLNNRARESYRNWTGTVLVDGSTFRKFGPNKLRSHQENSIRRKVILNGGWHFTSQGSISTIIEKFTDAQWLGSEVDWSKKIPELIKSNKSFRGGNVKFKVNERGLPKQLLLNREKYSHMMINPQKN